MDALRLGRYACVILTIQCLALLLLGCPGQPQTAAVPAAEQNPTAAAAGQAEPDDVIARVEGEHITFSQLNTMLNSSAVVGLSVPAIGSAERNQVRVALLDKMISANLLYLDALKQGVDNSQAWREQVANFADALLAALYRDRYLIGDIEVSEQEIREYMTAYMKPGTEPVEEIRLSIEATIRKRKFKEQVAGMRQTVRDDVVLVIAEGVMDAGIDATRADSDVIATLDGEPMTWSAFRPALLAINDKARLMEGGLGVDLTAERFETLNRIIDNRIMARKARAAGLEADPLFQSRFAEFRKTSLVNTHRGQVIEGLMPDEAQVRAYYNANRARISSPERRKIQMIVLKTEEEANAIRARIESGEITFHQAAQDHSIDPNAGKTLGEMGWVGQGTGFPELDHATFALGPDEISRAVHSPAGWHLVKVLDIRDATFQSIGDEATYNATKRMLIHEKLADYVVGLRLNTFQVSVDDKALERYFRAEAEWVASLDEKAAEPGSLTEQRVEEMKKFMQP